jgi:hypothetical protein
MLYNKCRLCGKPRDPEDTMDNPKPCGCEYTDAMKLRDVLVRIGKDIDLACKLAYKVKGSELVQTSLEAFDLRCGMIQHNAESLE